MAQVNLGRVVGYSAYEIAVQNGFEGTEAEWLASLKGETGADGQDGSSATIQVGTVSTGAAGSDAVVTNVGTSSAAVFNFTIPQGPAGTYTAGANITISNGEISATFTESDPIFGASAASTITASDISAWNAKQNALTAGTGIDITNNVISATGGGGTTYTAGDGIEIDQDTIHVLVDGTTIDLDGDNQLCIGSDVPDKNYVDRGLNGKQDTLTAGTGISIVNGVISVSLPQANGVSF